MDKYEIDIADYTLDVYANVYREQDVFNNWHWDVNVEKILLPGVKNKNLEDIDIFDELCFEQMEEIENKIKKILENERVI